TIALLGSGCDSDGESASSSDQSSGSESEFHSSDNENLGGFPAKNTPEVAAYLREFTWAYLSAEEPSRTNYNSESLFLENLLLWQTDPFYGWTNKNTKENGASYDLLKDGLKIHLTINSKMQAHAEWAVAHHMAELQDQLDSELARRSTFPANPSQSRYIDSLVIQSDRYKPMSSSGVSYTLIKEAFNTPIPMMVFDWKSPTHQLDTVMSPKDSIQYALRSLQTGLISTDPQTGFIKAWVGGSNYASFSQDNLNERRQNAGSLVLPFIYGSAIQQGLVEPCSTYPNVEYCFSNNDQSQNWCLGSYYGNQGSLVSIKAALAGSYNNIPLAIVNNMAGVNSTINFLENCGIPEGSVAPTPSILTGQFEVSLHDITAAYCVFANKGIYRKLQFISRIEDGDGNIITALVPPLVKEVMNEESAYAVIDMLTGVVDGVKSGSTVAGTGIRLRSSRPYAGFKNQIAGKTGTTQLNRDGWFIGLTPNLVTGVWVGAQIKEMSFRSLRSGQGANTALPIWGYYMNKIYADQEFKISKDDFERPAAYYFESNCEE
ncbi:MAG: hypothetical protein JKY54_07030, partial [Flavobacteriales bacterium]|nr:hypothetical protein [Flavobacteriales bacterium]